MGAPLFRSLERVPQLELDEARGSDGAENLAKCAGVFNIVERGAGKISEIPDIKEIRRKAKGLFFPKPEVLDQGEVPVLLERPAVNVATEVAKGFRAGRTGRIRSATHRVGVWSRHEVAWV